MTKQLTPIKPTKKMRVPLFKAPMEEKLTIYPGPRKALFENLVENTKVFLPELKLLYAAMNYNSEIKSEYILIFRGYVKGSAYIVWLAPFLYTDLAIPAYRYAVRTEQHDKFFAEFKEMLCRMRESMFYSFLDEHCSLSNNKTLPTYWKRPEYSEMLIREMGEMALWYNK